MITLIDKNAIIEIDITDILDGRGNYSSIVCNLYYKSNEVLFRSKNIEICYFELEELSSNLKDIIRNTIKSYDFKCDRGIISILFAKDHYSSDYSLDLDFLLGWESDTSLHSKLRLSEEQLKDFIKEIHYLMICFNKD